MAFSFQPSPTLPMASQPGSSQVEVQLQASLVTSHLPSMLQRDEALREVCACARLAPGACRLQAVGALSLQLPAAARRSRLLHARLATPPRCVLCCAAAASALLPACLPQQNFRACREVVLEAAQLYKDEADADKVRSSSSSSSKPRLPASQDPGCLHS